MRMIAIVAILICTSCSDKKDDSANENSTQPIHTIEFNGTGSDLETDKDSNLLAVSVRGQGLTFFETSSEDRPIEIGSVKLPYAYKALIKDKTVFGFDEELGLKTVDLRDLNQLNLVSALSSTELHGYVKDATLNGSKLILANESVGLNSYLIEDNFSLIDTTKKETNPESVQGVSNLSLYTNQFVTTSYDGIVSHYLWEENSDPELISSASTSIKMSDLSCILEFCYAASLAKGLSVIQIQQEEQPKVLDLIELPKTIDLVFADEDLLYVSYVGLESGNGFYVFDINDPANPFQFRAIATESAVRDFAKVGSNIYILLENGKLQIFKRETLEL